MASRLLFLLRPGLCWFSKAASREIWSAAARGTRISRLSRPSRRRTHGSLNLSYKLSQDFLVRYATITHICRSAHVSYLVLRGPQQNTYDLRPHLSWKEAYAARSFAILSPVQTPSREYQPASYLEPQGTPRQSPYVFIRNPAAPLQELLYRSIALKLSKSALKLQDFCSSCRGTMHRATLISTLTLINPPSPKEPRRPRPPVAQNGTKYAEGFAFMGENRPSRRRDIIKKRPCHGRGRRNHLQSFR